MARDESVELLGVHGVHKRFANGTVALKGVEFSVARATIHGLVGANGAGKSTLFKIIAAAQPPSSGEMVWKGRVVSWSEPGAARAAGISTIYQHIPLVPTLSVLENVFLGHTGRVFRASALRQRYTEISERIGYLIEPDAEVGDLSVGQRQMVAIMHALAADAELVLMDEPTASLSQPESERLFATIRRLRERERVSFVYCSHFLSEVLELTDVVTVLRDGIVVAHERSAELTEDRLIQLLVGQELADLEHDSRSYVPTTQKPVLEVEALTSAGKIDDVSFVVHAGEVVGLAGLLGSGRSEVLHAIFGADPKATGSVRVGGRVVKRSTKDAVRSGVALVPEERLREGLIGEWNIWRNVTLPYIERLSYGGAFPREQDERARAEGAIRDLGIVAQSVDSAVSSLSGGNAQKVTFAKWIYGDPTVLLLDEPTHGVDVGAKTDIVRIIRRLAAEGKAVVLVSSELQELLAETDRVIIMADGRKRSEHRSNELSHEDLLALVNGLTLREVPRR